MVEAEPAAGGLLDDERGAVTRRRRLWSLADYQLVDCLTQGYILLVALLILLFHGGAVDHWPAFVAGHVAVAFVVHCVIRLTSRSTGGFPALLRAFYPMILYTFLYTEVHHLDAMFYAGYLDGYFIDMDQQLFGCQPSRTMMQNFGQAWVSELFYASYFSYYVMVLTTGLALYLKRREQFPKYITVVSLVFYVCYLTFIFLPVMGPHGAESGLVFRGALASVGPRVVPESVTSGPFYRLMGVLYRLVEPGGGAAFPSSHVAVALATLWFTWRYLGRARWAHLFAVTMLCISTVYCGYHYAVDVLGGLATAAVFVPVGEWLYGRWPDRVRSDTPSG